MKMVKSLLLGSAAGILAVAGAQAADLPVKAKPVEYVKVCSLYGAGFFYMPGTDICLKVGGYMRFQAYYGNGNNGTAGAFYGQGGFETGRQGLTNDLVYRTRAVVTFDTRQQTEYGTLRTYTLLGFQHDSPGIGGNGVNTSEALYGKRGFIQIAGFTFGKAQSFWDIWSSPAVSYLSPPSSDTGDPGMMLAAYTAQFGNGFTGTISLEDPRRTTVANAATASTFTGVAGGALPTSGAWPAYGYGNVKWPDVVGVLRVDQAWGSAQVMAAIHNVDADYYSSATGAALGAASGTTGAGHASDKVGWAVGGGAIINTDFISRGDKFQFQVNYAQGASRYIDLTPAGSGSAFFYGSGNSFGFELITDGIYGAAGSNIELTKALGINASYDHRWNERWKTSVYGYYNSYKYSDQAKAYLAAAGGLCSTAGWGVSNCNPDSQQWGIGTRTQFNINASTYLGLDVMYRKIQTGFAGTATTFPTSGPRLGAQAGAPYTIEDQDAVTATFRIHRDFLP